MTTYDEMMKTVLVVPPNKVGGPAYCDRINKARESFEESYNAMLQRVCEWANFYEGLAGLGPAEALVDEVSCALDNGLFVRTYRANTPELERLPAAESHVRVAYNGSQFMVANRRRDARTEAQTQGVFVLERNPNRNAANRIARVAFEGLLFCRVAEEGPTTLTVQGERNNLLDCMSALFAAGEVMVQNALCAVQEAERSAEKLRRAHGVASRIASQYNPTTLALVKPRRERDEDDS